MKNAGAFWIGTAALIVALLASGCDTPTEPDTPSGPLAALTLIKPNGGESYTIGDTLRVEWIANPDSVPQIVMEISFDGGLTYFPMTDEAIGTGGGKDTTFAWLIPDSLYDGFWATWVPTPASDECLIHISDYVLEYNDYSDTTFSITQ